MISGVRSLRWRGRLRSRKPSMETMIIGNVYAASTFPLKVAGRVKRTRWRWRTGGFFRFLLLANAVAVSSPPIRSATD